MYISQLMQEGYKLEFCIDAKFYQGYLRADTQKKILYMVNTEKNDTENIEKLLWQADNFYAGYRDFQH